MTALTPRSVKLTPFYNISIVVVLHFSDYAFLND